MYLLEVLKRWFTDTTYFYHVCWAFMLTAFAWKVAVKVVGTAGWEVVLPAALFVVFKEVWDAKWGKKPDWRDHFPDAFSYVVGIVIACLYMGW